MSERGHNHKKMNADSMNSAMPSELYCLKCKARRPVLNVSLKDTTFTTTKNSKEVRRTIYQGTCSSCQKNVSCFAKGKKAPDAAQAPANSRSAIPPPKNIAM